MLRGRKERTPAQLAVLAQAREKAKIVIAERAKLNALAKTEDSEPEPVSKEAPQEPAQGSRARSICRRKDSAQRSCARSSSGARSRRKNQKEILSYEITIPYPWGRPQAKGASQANRKKGVLHAGPFYIHSIAHETHGHHRG